VFRSAQFTIKQPTNFFDAEALYAVSNFFCLHISLLYGNPKRRCGIYFGSSFRRSAEKYLAGKKRLNFLESQVNELFARLFYPRNKKHRKIFVGGGGAIKKNAASAYEFEQSQKR